MFACRHCWDHTLCFIHKQLPVSENLESESLSALSYYHLWAWLPPQLHNGIASMLSWRLWESSVITFVKDLGHRLCSRNVVPHFVNPPIGAERDGIWLNSFSCHCFLFLPQLFKLWHHFINMFFSFLRSIELPQELLKHLNANHMFLVLLWSKRQPMTPRFYMLGMIFCSGQLGHLCGDWHGFASAPVRTFMGVNPVLVTGCLLLGSARKVSTFSLSIHIYLFSSWWLVYQHSSEVICSFVKGGENVQ